MTWRNVLYHGSLDTLLAHRRLEVGDQAGSTTTGLAQPLPVTRDETRKGVKTYTLAVGLTALSVSGEAAG